MANAARVHAVERGKELQDRTMIAFGGKYPTTVIPSTLVLDRQHRVAAVFLRELLDTDLQPVVERLAAEN